MQCVDNVYNMEDSAEIEFGGSMSQAYAIMRRSRPSVLQWIEAATSNLTSLAFTAGQQLITDARGLVIRAVNEESRKCAGSVHPDGSPAVAGQAALACRILVVEDEGVVALDIAHALTQMGYVVTGTAASGEQAVRLAEETHPDMVLMDIRLRGTMDGIEAASQIRLQHSASIIFLTAFADEPTMQRAQAVQPAAILRKPYEKGALQDAIEAAMSPPP